MIDLFQPLLAGHAAYSQQCMLTMYPTWLGISAFMMTTCAPTNGTSRIVHNIFAHWVWLERHSHDQISGYKLLFWAFLLSATLKPTNSPRMVQNEDFPLDHHRMCLRTSMPYLRSSSSATSCQAQGAKPTAAARLAGMSPLRCQLHIPQPLPPEPPCKAVTAMPISFPDRFLTPNIVSSARHYRSPLQTLKTLLSRACCLCVTANSADVPIAQCFI